MTSGARERFGKKGGEINFELMKKRARKNARERTGVPKESEKRGETMSQTKGD